MKWLRTHVCFNVLTEFRKYLMEKTLGNENYKENIEVNCKAGQHQQCIAMAESLASFIRE